MAADRVQDAPRVLLVEDSLIAAAHIQDQLLVALPGARVVHVRTLAQALAQLGERWDIVLTDLGLPDCDGIETVLHMRETARQIPIVVLTAHDDADLAQLALEEYVQDFLVKGRIDADVLARAIRYAIGRQLIYARLEAAASEARRNERNLYQLIARSADGVVVFDGQMRVAYANDAACPILAKARGDLIGYPLPEIAEAEDGAEVTISVEHGVRVVDVRMVEVDWEGQPATLALLRDMTERKSAEELRLQLERSERLASLGQLAAGVAHEINNPLAYVISNLELLRRDVDRLAETGAETQGARARIKTALEGAQRVAKIVRDLGTFTRRDLDDPPAPTDVNAVLEGALTMAVTQLKHRATIKLELGDISLALANPGRLSQVFLNLLVNAAHAMPEGRAQHNHLKIRSFAQGREIVVEIEDSGTGISSENLTRVFDPFFTTKKVGEGSGLGLYICRNIMHSYGGELQLDSTVGKGTTARVRLPVWERRTSPPTALESVRPARATNGSCLRILVIDDELAILESLTAGLTPHHVACVSSGEEAITLLGSGARFDLILCDVVMPERTGPEVLEWVEAQRPELAERIVFMSGGSVGRVSSAFLDAHRDRILAKPFAFQDVLDRVEALSALRS